MQTTAVTHAAPAPRDLDTPYPLRPEDIRFYRDNGFVRLKSVFDPATLEHYRLAIGRKVQELNTETRPMEERSTYQKAFLQIMNLWKESDEVRELSFSKRLARIATELMGTAGVRMYHDQALYKEPGGGHTPRHADQYYWPLSNENTVTVWIPLQPTPLEMGPLAFAAKSHHVEIGRDLDISDESEVLIGKEMESRGFDMVESGFELGEVSFHAGWTFHRAGGNRTQRMREAFTVIYMDSEMRLVQPRHPFHYFDWYKWMPGAVVGEKVATELNPVLYERS